MTEYGVPCSIQPDADSSDAFLMRHSPGAKRQRGGDTRASTGSFDVALPVPIVLWQAIWASVI